MEIGIPLHKSSGEVIGVCRGGADAAVGGLHDCCEDKAAVDAGRVGDVDDRFMDGGDLVFGVAGYVP